MPSMDTKEQIVEAFSQVAKTKNIDKITVKDVVTECGISRQSFYYHFQDILQITEWSFEQKIQLVLEKSQNAATVQEALCMMIEEIKSNKALFRKICSSDRRELLEKKLIEIAYLFLEKLNKTRMEEQCVNPKELDFAFRLYSVAFTEYMILNIDEEMESEILANQMYKILSGQIKLFS